MGSFYMQKIHDVGQEFNLSKYLKARELTIKAVQMISDSLEEGMSENDGHELIDSTLTKLGSDKKWHPNKFRFGKNTTKSFREISDHSIKLKSNDIYFLDIGPVFDGHEGDYGETFIFNNNNSLSASVEEYKKIILVSRSVFQLVVDEWKVNPSSGANLYQFAEKKSQELGYQLNLKMAGHRLSDFPHAIHFKGSLSEVDSVPEKNLWILEILIRHPTQEIGAFFEDIIM
ncbi:MAG: M24 family metallopeptidase [Bacteriovoracaceae bacterium]|nr:M24 family metallopeptidase [Bacteriovoracaceae bacterium]